MNSKKMLFAWIGGFVIMFLLSYIWYNLIIADYNAVQYAGVLKETVGMGNITVGYLVVAFLLAYIYPKGYSGGSPGSEGLRFGLVMGLLYTLPAAFINAGAFGFPFTAQIVGAAYHTVEVIAGSLVIAKIYGEIK
ncbi:MAG: hypothetical protein V3U16_02585 [Candidatus Neomarinimicrobiota bacterium]